MNLGDERESGNFEDHTLGPWAYTPQGKNLLHHMLQIGQQQSGAPGGYGNWLKNALSNLTPQDYATMRASGMTINDIMRLHEYVNGQRDIDPSAYPYNDDTANAAVKRMRNR